MFLRVTEKKLHPGDGTFRSTLHSHFYGYLYSLKTADLNGDGRPEIIISQSNYSNGTLSVLENLGEGRFEVAGTFYNGGSGGDIEARDIDGDLDLDIVMEMYDGAKYLENVTGAQQFSRGCDPFLRGDVNVDGMVSLSDLIMLRRYLFTGEETLLCLDAADITDRESFDVQDVFVLLDALFQHEDWTLSLPEPFSEPGVDLTPLPVANSLNEGRDLNMDARVGCAEYRIQPPEKTDDLIRLGNVYASPGAEVLVPVYITNSVPVEAVQLVIKHEPDVLEIVPDGLSHERTYYEEAFPAEPPFLAPELSILTLHPNEGVATVAIAGRFVFSDRQISPGSNTLIAWIRVKVSEDATPGTTLTLNPTNGEDGQGVGPFRLRNEICYEGDARLVSTIPLLEGAILNIVGDQAFFRGDSNGDEKLDLSDAVNSLNAFFMGSAQLVCPDAADANDDGILDISDPICTLSLLFLGGAPLPPPYPYKGYDPTSDALRCASGNSGI